MGNLLQIKRTENISVMLDPVVGIPKVNLLLNWNCAIEIGKLRLKNWYLSFQPCFRIDKTTNNFNMEFIYFSFHSEITKQSIFSEFIFVQFPIAFQCFDFTFRLLLWSIFIWMACTFSRHLDWYDRIVLCFSIIVDRKRKC